jgi:uncharacterized alkaline shock family protein YloU
VTLTDGPAIISSDILASYAADAAREAPGVAGLVDGRVPGRRAVRVAEEAGALTVELHLAVDWGASIPAVARDVQRRVREYLGRMADVEPVAVDVVVDEIGRG